MKASLPEPFHVIFIGAGLLLASLAFAQVPDAPAGGAPAGGAAPAPAAAPAAQPAPGAAGGGQKNGSFLGNDVPSYDPGTEIMTWDGKNWNVNNNRIFEAR